MLPRSFPYRHHPNLSSTNVPGDPLACGLRVHRVRVVARVSGDPCSVRIGPDPFGAGGAAQGLSSSFHLGIQAIHLYFPASSYRFKLTRISRIFTPVADQPLLFPKNATDLRFGDATRPSGHISYTHTQHDGWRLPRATEKAENHVGKCFCRMCFPLSTSIAYLSAPGCTAG